MTNLTTPNEQVARVADTLHAITAFSTDPDPRSAGRILMVHFNRRHTSKDREAILGSLNAAALSATSAPKPAPSPSLVLSDDPWEALEQIRAAIWRASADGLTFGPQVHIAQVIEQVQALSATPAAAGDEHHHSVAENSEKALEKATESITPSAGDDAAIQRARTIFNRIAVSDAITGLADQTEIEVLPLTIRAMLEFASTEYARGLEDAARVATDHARRAWDIAQTKRNNVDVALGRNHGARDIASAIRALSSDGAGA